VAKWGGALMVAWSRYAAIVALLALSSGVRAGDGDLDPGFNGSGEASAFAGTTSGGNVQVLGQPDGQVVLIGILATGPTLAGSLGITRLHADGSIDTSFGANGKATVDAPSGGGLYRAYGALDASGRIVAGGTLDFGDHSAMFVMRLTAGGQLDSTFNHTGTLVINRTFVTAQGDTVAGIGVFSDLVAADDTILVAGSMQDQYGKFNARDLAVVPLHADGSYSTDVTVGNGAFFFGSISDIARCFRSQLSGGNGYDSAVAMVRRRFPASGTELTAVAANAFSAGNVPGFGAVIELDGSLHTIGSFGISGVSEFNFAAGGTTQVKAIALDDSNRVLVAGSDTSSAHFNLGVGRILTTGYYDTSFNGTGRLTINFDESGGTFYSEGEALLAQSDGRVLVGAQVYSAAVDGHVQFGLVRLAAGGTADTTFTSGTSITGAHKYIFSSSNDFANTASFTQGEKVLLSGIVDQPSNTFGVLRTTNDHIFGDGAEIAAYLPRTP